MITPAFYKQSYMRPINATNPAQPMRIFWRDGFWMVCEDTGDSVTELCVPSVGFANAYAFTGSMTPKMQEELAQYWQSLSEASAR